MDLLTDVEESNLLEMMFPSVEKDMLKAIAEISHSTRVEMSAESPRLSNMISTRMSVEIAGLLSDGFGLDEASEIEFILSLTLMVVLTLRELTSSS